MSEINLKEYTSRAKELEVAIYTQQRLMKRHEQLLKDQFPATPKIRKVKKPTKPNPDDYRLPQKPSMWISLIGMYVIGISSLIAIIIGDADFWWWLGVGVGVISIFFTKDQIQTDRNMAAHSQELAEKYKRAEQQYRCDIKEYAYQLELARKEHDQAMIDYQCKVAEYDSQHNAIAHSHSSALASLEMALQSHYNENVIFSKYRNLVAITAINEYLLSGRCYNLEGPDGAYNLYEMELRQNIVIGKLSNIISNLEQIRENQYSLYEELKHSNELIDSIIGELRDIHTNTQLTAYFSEIVALAETSPKFYISTTI